MCGIAALISPTTVSKKELLELLKKLQHRGYDGYGLTTCYAENVQTEHYANKINLESVEDMMCNYGIAHTRYKTYGDVMFCQPILNKTGTLALVHNGQVEAIGDVGIDSESILNILDEKIEELTLKGIIEGILEVWKTIKVPTLVFF